VEFSKALALALYCFLYINELTIILEKYGIKVKLFADDVKLYVKLYVQIVNDG